MQGSTERALIAKGNDVNLPPGIFGSCAEGFEPCVQAFAANFSKGEIGAACSIRVGEESVVDVWGGLADPATGRAWSRDSLVAPFSVSKGVAAVCVLELVKRGLIDLDRPVAHYWPEFAQGGKERISVREALAHRAGVPFISGEIRLEALSDPASMAARLASETPLFEPGAHHLYHAITIGWITSELVRRVTGVPIGIWLAENVAEPLGLSLFFGLPESQRERAARVLHRDQNAAGLALAEVMTEGSIPWRTLTLNGTISFAPEMGNHSLNDYALQALELAGANLMADARSLAAFYAACLAPVRGIRLLSDEVIADACRPVSTGAQFGMSDDGPAWGAGVMIPWKVQPMLPGTSFGHDGMGGSLAFANVERQCSFAYVRNGHVVGGVKDPEVYSVVEALEQILNGRN